ncbi:hypothetical protein Mpe_A1713 [Methylibium petroleiphilum PM1]|uniref:Uncharacterized protein n=1 Tax=Methylibium petroleiphilum (strain ATCC BAA-1232 / LMG 22953 / PM1) TaxID=420662 RepID=A2SGI4_METPP|nr:hypothetical protein Mpe_A1713 [Methylibium petroleiphilum PM1]
MTPLKTAARTRQVSATPSVTTERPWFAAADGFHVNERACALVSRKLQPLGSPFAAGMTGLLFNRRLLWVDSASSRPLRPVVRPPKRPLRRAAERSRSRSGHWTSRSTQGCFRPEQPLKHRA